MCLHNLSPVERETGGSAQTRRNAGASCQANARDRSTGGANTYIER
jgi:hypothetical protein